MMRNSVHSWAQEPWPLLDNSLDMTNFDSNSFLNADQVLQLHDLFGQDQLDFDGDTSLLYDEFTFESNMVDTVEPSNLTNENYVMNTIVNEPEKKRRNSTSSNSSLSSCSSSDSEEDTEDFSSIANNQDESDSSDSEAEQEVISPYLHRRQMEEMILDKITNHLDAEKLPGILTIISKSHEEVEEVEIDLAKLDRDQLNRILAYVNDCLMEKEGGPKVQISNYTVQPASPKPLVTLPTSPLLPAAVPKKSPKASTTSSRRRRNNSKRRKSIVEEGHVVNGSSTSRLSTTHGPISMSALTEIESSTKKKSRRKRVTKKMKNDDDVSVHMPTDLNSFKDSIASTKPKRRSAVHKRRLLEDMLQPSSDDSSSEEDNGNGIIVFGDEQMDLAVTQNETIIHQEQTTIVEQKLQEEINNVIDDEDDDDDDELIDIMM
ncbi:hypothetical protein BD770DRAFT_385082 [Pilaira anomala]|nr:hypothetical protein BD770DRAFT_385082 [Pilaira anomala]